MFSVALLRLRDASRIVLQRSDDDDVQRRVTVATAAIIRSGICDASRIVLQRFVL
ncbi:hypothetical protein CEXT_56251, partial [Caerostris extrusa]